MILRDQISSLKVEKLQMDGLEKQITDKYDIITSLGQGRYGKVYKAQNKVTKKIVALKMIKMDQRELYENGFPHLLMREICFLKELKHENIVPLLEVIRALNVWLVFSFDETDLESLIGHRRARGEKLTETEVISYTRQILMGLMACHAAGVCHRDLKPSNILITKNNVVQIADFGLANRVLGKGTVNVITLNYRPLELLLHEGSEAEYGTEVDMWSMGCILYEMITGRILFHPTLSRCEDMKKQDMANRMEIAREILQICGSPDENGWPEWRRFPASAMLAEMRLEGTTLRRHLENEIREPFRDSIELILSMLELNPKRRITAEQAFRHPFLLSRFGKYDPENMAALEMEEKTHHKKPGMQVRRGV